MKDKIRLTKRSIFHLLKDSDLQKMGLREELVKKIEKEDKGKKEFEKN
jgi:hypothetical protein